jgi:hypothetical protein
MGAQVEGQQSMKTMSLNIVRLTVLWIMLVFTGCSDSTTDSGNEEPTIDRPGFTATVSGAVNGEVSGPGIVTYLPPKERDIVTGNRPGYYLFQMLVNNLPTDSIGGREVIIIFRIPDGAQPGNYHLMTPDPLKVGKDFDVQVETVEEGRSIAYQTNTEGTLTLDNFSPDRITPETSAIKGTFQFVTENSDGEQVSVNGSFDFPSEKKVVVQDLTFPLKEGSRV